MTAAQPSPPRWPALHRPRPGRRRRSEQCGGRRHNDEPDPGRPILLAGAVPMSRQAIVPFLLHREPLARPFLAWLNWPCPHGWPPLAAAAGEPVRRPDRGAGFGAGLLL